MTPKPLAFRIVISVLVFSGCLLALLTHISVSAAERLIETRSAVEVRRLGEAWAAWVATLPVADRPQIVREEGARLGDSSTLVYEPPSQIVYPPTYSPQDRAREKNEIERHGFAIRYLKNPRFGTTVEYSRRIAEDATEFGLLRMTKTMHLEQDDLAPIARHLRSTALWGLFGLALFLVWTVPRALRPVRLAAESTRALLDQPDTVVWPPEKIRELAELREHTLALALRLKARTEAGERGIRSLETILHSMAEGVLAVDMKQNILLVNDVARKLLEVRSEVERGVPLSSITRHMALLDLTDRVLNDGCSQGVEIRVSAVPADVLIEAQAAPLRDSKTGWSGCVIVLHDVTTMRRLETMRRDFVANVSHELKTPLTTIQGSAETILDDPDMPPDITRRFITKIHSNAERLSSLITDLLELSRIQSGLGVLEKKRIDLRALLDESAARFVDAADEKNITLEPAGGDSEVTILGDRRALSALFDNLVSNGVRYTPEGGTVKITMEDTGDTAVIAVSDSGIGIEAKHLDRIFERFYRVDGARSRHLGGTGLGLSIVKNAVAAHNGRIQVESTLGKGTTFRVTLPRAPRQREV